MKPSTTPGEAAGTSSNAGASRSSSRVALLGMDRDALITRWDPSSEALYGWSQAEALGKTLPELVADSEDRISGALEAIRESAPWEGELPVRCRDGSILRSYVSVFPPVEGRPSSEEVIGVARTVEEDGPEEGGRSARDREWRLAFLADASAALASSLKSERTLRKVARLGVPTLADWCAVDVVDTDGSIRRLTLAHADPEKEVMGGRLPARYPAGGNTEAGLGAVLLTGRTEFFPSVAEAMLEWLAYDDRHLELLRALGLRSVICVPLVSRGRMMGAITFAVDESRRVYGADDVRLAEELGRRAAGAMDNARLYEERSYIARTLQRSLLPPRLPEIPDIELAAKYRAAGEGIDVGGDFYDVFEVAKGSWALVVGDVCGKGADAAAITGLARHTIRTASMREWRPRRVLLALNEALLRDHGDQYCTVALAQLGWVGSRVRATVACGGHPSPLLVRADGTVEAVGQPGTLLGVFADPELATAVLDLRRGDTLLFYTDGVTESRGPGDGLSERELRALLASHAGMSAQRLADAVEEAAVSAQPGGTRDDIALVCVRVSP